MKRRQKDIFAGVLLLLVLPLSWQFSKLSFDRLNEVRKYLGFSFLTRSLAFFLMFSPDILFVIIPVTALVASIFAFFSRRRTASVIAVFSILLMLVSFGISFIYWLRDPRYSFRPIFEIFSEVVLGRDVFHYYVHLDYLWISHVPVLILLGVSAVLLYSRSASTNRPQAAYAFQPQISTQVPATQVPVNQVPYGAKKCPECAELIQVDAIKCRFCNYRYS